MSLDFGFICAYVAIYANWFIYPYEFDILLLHCRKKSVMIENKRHEIEKKMVREVYENMDYDLFVEGKTISSSYPDQLRDIQEDMIHVMAKVRRLKMVYKQGGSLPLKSKNSDFDCLNRTMDYMYEELLSLISDRHYVKKVYSDGKCISNIIQVDD